jgi:transposase
MKRILYVGMDVHKESYTVSVYDVVLDKTQYQQKLQPDYKMVLRYLEKVRSHYTEEVEYICGYEAGCLGYTLYHELTDHGVNCVIMAPSTMAITNKNHVKTDKRDADSIARCLAFRSYGEVYVPTAEDESVKEYIRMRDDQKKALKIIKQQILALVLRHGYRYEDGSNYWTGKHVKWLKEIKLGGVFHETLEEYLSTYSYFVDKLTRFDQRIEELSAKERYREQVTKLKCFIGVKTYTALSVLVEVGDFNRFPKASSFASFLGLVPGEDSSGDKQRRGSITKTGNSHVRRILVEAAQG